MIKAVFSCLLLFLAFGGEAKEDIQARQLTYNNYWSAGNLQYRSAGVGVSSGLRGYSAGSSASGGFPAGFAGALLPYGGGGGASVSSGGGGGGRGVSEQAGGQTAGADDVPRHTASTGYWGAQLTPYTAVQEATAYSASSNSVRRSTTEEIPQHSTNVDSASSNYHPGTPPYPARSTASHSADAASTGVLNPFTAQESSAAAAAATQLASSVRSSTDAEISHHPQVDSPFASSTSPPEAARHQHERSTGPQHADVAAVESEAAIAGDVGRSFSPGHSEICDYTSYPPQTCGGEDYCSNARGSGVCLSREGNGSGGFELCSDGNGGWKAETSLRVEDGRCYVCVHSQWLLLREPLGATSAAECGRGQMP